MASMNGDVQAQEINFDEEQETLVEGMTGHVHEFKIQREYFQQKDSEAKNDTINNTELENRTVVYCGDYSQNLDLPHFGGEQPGDTYYFSPLIVNVFGLADLCTKDDVLSTFIYTEAEGNKGGNNVCSLIYKKLNDDGFIEASEPAKQLCLFFDNCGGQNKNRMVLRLAQFLVDTSVFSRVEVVFFIVGHTKNVCDRRFKDVKKNFHPRQVYDMDELIHVVKMDANDQHNNLLDVHRVNGDDFYDFDSFFDKFYKHAIPHVTKYHFFVYDKSFKGVVKMKRTVSPEEKFDEFFLPKLDKNYSEDDMETWLSSIRCESSFPEKEKAKELSDIKQVELYTKWRSFVPDDFKDIICPEPSEDVMDRVKNDKSKKRKAKATRDATNTKKRKGNPISKDEGEKYLNMRIGKYFRKELFLGTVTRYDEEEEFWAVTYDDDDWEEFDYKQLLKAIKVEQMVKRP